MHEINILKDDVFYGYFKYLNMLAHLKKIQADNKNCFSHCGNLLDNNCQYRQRGQILADTGDHIHCGAAEACQQTQKCLAVHPTLLAQCMLGERKSLCLSNKFHPSGIFTTRQGDACPKHLSTCC